MIAMKNNRIFNYALIVSFLLGIMLPLIASDTKEVSDVEKRNLAKLPILSWNFNSFADYPDQFEKFFDDHFGFREKLVYIYARLNFILGISITEKTAVGKNGWLFYTEDGLVADYENRVLFTNIQLLQWKETLRARYNWLKEQNIEYVFVIVPNKATVYEEHLPSYIRKTNNTSRYDQLMTLTEVPILDIRSSLLRAKMQEELYYKTDTHWNDMGANIAQYEIAKYLSATCKDITPILFETEDFEYKPSLGKDLAAMMNLKDIFKEISPIFKKKNNECQIYKPASDNLPYPYVITKCTNNSIDALVFGDSFLDALKPYLSHYFKNTMYMQAMPKSMMLEKLVRSVKPRIVIEERIER
ncbi:MAG: hypothetical protein GY749_24545, partial [Desulfobacteraceae bacterium]|nr:hypothetical protein [Desulfobacteraceae bacterium]